VTWHDVAWRGLRRAGGMVERGGLVSTVWTGRCIER
jgi:hypothetical protein